MKRLSMRAVLSSTALTFAAVPLLVLQLSGCGTSTATTSGVTTANIAAVVSDVANISADITADASVNFSNLTAAQFTQATNDAEALSTAVGNLAAGNTSITSVTSQVNSVLSEVAGFLPDIAAVASLLAQDEHHPAMLVFAATSTPVAAPAPAPAATISTVLRARMAEHMASFKSHVHSAN